MNETYIKNVIEAALLAAGRPLQIGELTQLFDENARPDEAGLRAAFAALEADYSTRGIEVKETSSGFRIQVRKDLANEVSRLWPERPPRYSRALLETLALIAYRQPITRAEIESVRGVAVNPNIIKTVIERNWVKVVGTRDVPGRPELLGTTQDFLDYFGLRSLDELPPLAELKAMGDVNLQLDLAKPGEGDAAAAGAVAGAVAAAGAAAAAGAESADGDAADSAAAGAEAASGDAADADAVAAAGAAGGDADGGVAAADADTASDSTSAADAVATAATDSDGSPSAALDASVEATASDTVAASADSSDATEAGVQPGAVDAQPDTVAIATSGDPVATPEHSDEVEGEPDAVSAAVGHMEIESDSGDVTVEVEALSLVEARIEATLEGDDEQPAAGDLDGTDASVAAADADDVAADVASSEQPDTTLETGEFEMSELGVAADDRQTSAEVIEAEFDADDLTSVTADSDDAEEADDEEELSASSSTATKFVAGPRDNDD